MPAKGLVIGCSKCGQEIMLTVDDVRGLEFSLMAESDPELIGFARCNICRGAGLGPAAEVTSTDLRKMGRLQ